MSWCGLLSNVLIVPVLFFHGEAAAQGKIAFTSFTLGDFAAGVFPQIEKNVLDLAGGDLTIVDDFPYETLGFGRYGGPFYWSPDKTRTITLSDKGVFVADANGANEVLIGSTDSDSAPDPRWSPDGTKIILSLGPQGRRQIYVVDEDGGGLANLSNSTSDDYLPYWSPDGTQIVFTSSQGLDTEIYLMESDGNGKVNLTNYPDADYLTSWSPQGPWSPDGDRILFLSYRNGNSDIFVMNRDGSSPTNLTESSDSEDSPVWSPDGTQIVYVLQSFGTDGLIFGDIYTMDADGTNQVNLTNSPSVRELNPFWVGGSPASVIEAESWGRIKSLVERGWR